MTVDYSKFPMTGIENPHATTLTEAVATPPVSAGYILVTLKVGRKPEFVETIRNFAKSLRADAAGTGVTDVTAYREFQMDEMGGGIPFDQVICKAMLKDAKHRQATQPDKWPTTKFGIQIMEGNEMADWAVLVEFADVDRARAAAVAWNGGDDRFAALTRDVGASTVNAFKNTMGYASVSRDPNLIQFFNLFPGPGDVDVLWQAWQEALPWFLEVGEFRSSFPLVALDPDQPLLVVNYAHCDSIKHFFLGVCFDPNFIETVTRCYADRGFHLPLPFFCKIVPV